MSQINESKKDDNFGFNELSSSIADEVNLM